MDKILTLRSLRVDKEYLVELITDFQNVVFRTQGIERYCESEIFATIGSCLLYTSPSPRDRTRSRMPSSA